MTPGWSVNRRLPPAKRPQAAPARPKGWCNRRPSGSAGFRINDNPDSIDCGSDVSSSLAPHGQGTDGGARHGTMRQQNWPGPLSRRRHLSNGCEIICFPQAQPASFPAARLARPASRRRMPRNMRAPVQLWTGTERASVAFLSVSGRSIVAVVPGNLEQARRDRARRCRRINDDFCLLAMASAARNADSARVANVGNGPCSLCPAAGRMYPIARSLCLATFRARDAAGSRRKAPAWRSRTRLFLLSASSKPRTSAGPRSRSHAKRYAACSGRGGAAVQPPPTAWLDFITWRPRAAYARDLATGGDGASAGGRDRTVDLRLALLKDRRPRLRRRPHRKSQRLQAVSRPRCVVRTSSVNSRPAFLGRWWGWPWLSWHQRRRRVVAVVRWPGLPSAIFAGRR